MVGRKDFWAEDVVFRLLLLEEVLLCDIMLVSGGEKRGHRRISRPNHRMKLTGAAILVSRGMNVLQAAPAAYPYR